MSHTTRMTLYLHLLTDDPADIVKTYTGESLDPAAIPYAISEIDELIARTLSKLDRYTQSDWHHADPPDTNGDI